MFICPVTISTESKLVNCPFFQTGINSHQTDTTTITITTKSTSRAPKPVIKLMLCTWGDRFSTFFSCERQFSALPGFFGRLSFVEKSSFPTQKLDFTLAWWLLVLVVVVQNATPKLYLWVLILQLWGFSIWPGSPSYFRGPRTTLNHAAT